MILAGVPVPEVITFVVMMVMGDLIPGLLVTPWRKEADLLVSFYTLSRCIYTACIYSWMCPYSHTKYVPTVYHIALPGVLLLHLPFHATIWWTISTS